VGSVSIPEWTWKAITGLISAVLLATMSWAWSAEARIAQVENDAAQCIGKLETVNSNQSSIQVIETRLQYIERGIDEIKDLLKERQ